MFNKSIFFELEGFSPEEMESDSTKKEFWNSSIYSSSENSP